MGKVRMAVVSVAMLAVLSMMAGQAWGGVLAADPNGMAAWQGSTPYSNSYVGASLDYCVYDKGKFAESFPVPGAAVDANDYVYAYQVNVLTAGTMPSWAYVIQFSVGLDADEQCSLIGAWDDTSASLVMPSDSSFAVDNQAARWYFSSQIAVDQHSGILYFASPFGPQTDQGTMSGAMPVATHNVASPLPEPCCALVLLIGGAIAVRRRR